MPCSVLRSLVENRCNYLKDIQAEQILSMGLWSYRARVERQVEGSTYGYLKGNLEGEN
jgi:hypothetical protein